MIYENLITTWVRIIKEILPEHKIIREEGAVGEGSVRPNEKFVTIKLISGPRDYSIREGKRFNSEDIMELFSAKAFTLSINAYRCLLYTSPSPRD